MSDMLPALITGGLGAAIGSIGTAMIQSISSRGESRAIAADRVTNAAGNLADRLDKMNSTLEARLARSEDENRQMRQALMALAEAVEDLLPVIPDDVHEKVQAALNKARISFR